MNERMTKLMNYEKRLLQDRMQLQHLIEEWDAGDSEMMKNKIQHFQREIEYMESQLTFLMDAVEEKKYESVAPSFVEESTRVVQPEQETLVKKTVQAQSEPSDKKFTESTVEQRTAVQKNSQPQKLSTHTKDLENTIGKSLMGILASVLIFISLILFATLLLPYFNDTAKMITTYMLSFAFLAVGMFKLQKDADNKFYIALTGCGIGAVYISLLLSNMYFKVFGDITLYVLIGIWAIGVCFLSKIKNNIFQIIGQFGIVIAMIFGCILCIENGDAIKFMALVIFYAISSGAFYFVHFDKEFSNNLVQNIFNTINLGILYCGNVYIFEEGIHISTIIIMLLMAFYVGVSLYSTIEKTGIAYGLVVGTLSFMFFSLMSYVVENDMAFALITYVTSLSLAVIIERKESEKERGKNIALVALITLAYFGLEVSTSIFRHGIVPMMILPILVYGFYRANNVMKYGSMVLFGCYIFIDGAGELERFLLGSVVVAAVFFLIYKNAEQYSKMYKNCAHIVSLLFLLLAVEDVIYFYTNSYKISDLFSYAAVTIFNAAMLKSFFGRNIETGEEESHILYNLVNLLCMIIGLCTIDHYNDTFLHMVIIITTLIAFMVNAKNLLDKRDNIWAGIYVGIKFTILMIVILESFDSVNYVISVACFVLAILSIVIGFVGQYKSLRIFGLVLSMISTFKLIMIDINYSNTLGNALSFFASGILCFVISLIYNYIDKKIQSDD